MKKIQDQVELFCKENDMDASAQCRFMDLVSEIGELSKEFLKSTQYGKKPLEYRDSFEDEMGDVLFSLITTANSLGIDLQKALEGSLDKYKTRIERKKSANSD